MPIDIRDLVPNAPPEEHIVLVVRRHLISFIPHLAIVIALFLIGLGGFITSLIGVPNFGAFTLPVLAASEVFMLAGLALFLQSFIDYYFDLGIVTTERVIDWDQRGLFHRTVSEHHLEVIQDVSARQRGVLQTFFGYGDVFVQTAGTEPNFEFQAVPDPGEISAKINELVYARKRRAPPPPVGGEVQTGPQAPGSQAPQGPPAPRTSPLPKL